MIERERFDKENETITDIIQRGQFLNARQGAQVGKLIAEGIVKGLTRPIELSTRLESSE